LSLEDARRLVDRFVTHYNQVRLHSALGYVAPADRLAGRQDAIFAERDGKLQRARVIRARHREAMRVDATRKEQEERLAGESRGVAMNALWSA
jgi:putative transposase